MKLSKLLIDLNIVRNLEGKTHYDTSLKFQWNHCTSQNMPQCLLLFCSVVDLLVLVLHLYMVMPGKSLDVNICCRLCVP